MGTLLQRVGNRAKQVATAMFSRGSSPPQKLIVSSGAEMIGGQFDFEDATELRSYDSRHEKYREMAQRDAYISESLRSNKLPLIGRATWIIEPGVEPSGVSAETPEELRSAEIRDFIAANLFSDENDNYGRKFWMQTSWSQFLREVLMFLDHGFSVFHKEWASIDNKWVLKRLVWLEPKTIYRWNCAVDGSLLSITRRYRREDGTYEGNEEIPAEELSLFVWDITGTRLEGVPLIRAMYGPWKRKEFLLRCKMIAAQRGAVGIPWATYDEGENGSEDPSMIEEALQSSLGQGLEHSYITSGNKTLKLGYLQQDPKHLDAFDGMAEDENLSIGHAGGIKAQMLGEQPNGSRSVGEVQQKLQFILTEAIAKEIAEQLLRGISNIPGIISELVDRNFGDVARYPYIKVTGVDPDESTKNLDFVIRGTPAGLVPKHPSVKREFMRRCGFDLPDEAFEEDTTEEDPIIPQGAVVGQDDPPPDGDPPNEEGLNPQALPKGIGGGGAPGKTLPLRRSSASSVESLARRLTFRMTLQEMLLFPSSNVTKDSARSSGFGRQPTEFEATFIALGVVSGAVTNGASRIASVLKKSRRVMIDDILARGRAGKITKSTLGGLRRSVPKKKTELMRRLREQLNATAFAGKQHASEELARQIEYFKDRGHVQQLTIRLEGDDSGLPGDIGDGVIPPGLPLKPVAKAKKVLIADAVIQDLIEELAEESRVISEINIDALWSRMLDASIIEYQRLTTSGLEGEELWTQLEGFLDDLSTKPLDAVGRKMSTVSYNQGRDIAIQQAAAKGDAAYAVRSELMDTSTCSVCATLDGTIVEIGSSAYDALMPPARCLGGDQCRGFYVVISNAAVESDQ